MTTKKEVVKENTTINKNKKNKATVTTENKVIATKKESINSNIYPIGKLEIYENIEEAAIQNLINDFKILPKKLKIVYKNIKKNKELQYSYKDGGWSVEQIFHHIADSHTNGFIRFKLTLTENTPTVAPYNENLWAETADIQLPIKTAVHLTKYIHEKWVALMENMDKNEWKRTFYHPDSKKNHTLEEILQKYAWHGKHHLAQIEVALKLKK